MISKESVINQRHESDKERFAQIPHYIQEILEHRNENIDVAQGLVSEFSNLDNIPSQAALLGFATQLTSVPTVHKTLALEMVKSENILPFIGSLAVQKISENIAIENKDVDIYIKEITNDYKKQKENFALWDIDFRTK